MFKNVKSNHIFIFILVIIVLIYLGKLLYGNLNNKLNYKTTYYDEDTDGSDEYYFDESDSYTKLAEINNSIKPIPDAILTGPINDKADLSRNKIIDEISEQ